MQIFYLTLLTFFTSIIGTVSGFGISTIMVPIVLLIFPLPETLLLVGVIHWFGDLWKIFLFKKGFDWKLFIYFGIPGIMMAFVGAILVFEIPETLSQRFVGILIIAYVIFLFKKPSFKIKKTPQTAMLGGASSGFLGGLTGVGGGALRAIVLTAFNIPKEVYIFTSGVLGALIDASRIVTYFAAGARVNHVMTIGMLFFIPASFIGAKIAKRIVNKMPQESFRNLIAIFLFILGLKFVLFP